MSGELAKPPVVMKFGGSSVSSLDEIRLVAERVAARAAEQPVVVVVSAMGKTTNELIAQARTLCEAPPARELDMLLTTGERQSMALLAIAIARHGKVGVSLTGSQCGIITDHQHGQARIMEVRPFRILDELAAGHVVIVGGFQGVSYRREVTTLGRGGTDTTAVALAAALGADCEIYSDVDGIYTADPRDVAEARRLEVVSYEEMQALARAGAKVLHAQAVQLAQEQGIAIYARATNGGGQSVVRSNPVLPSGVRAVASDPSIITVCLEVASATGWSCPHDLAAAIGGLGLRYLTIDERGARGLLSATQRADTAEMLARIGEIASRIPGPLATVAAHEGLALTSCVGTGLEERPGLVGEALAELSSRAIEVRQICTDSHTLGFVVPADQRSRAVECLHTRFVTEVESNSASAAS